MYTSENICPDRDYLNASGPVTVPMTNDYLLITFFRKSQNFTQLINSEI